jgi:glycosyltransferase involved in cell wall biosynthesis
MTKLRIAMLTTFYPPYSFGGDAIGIERLASAMADRGHDLTIIHSIDAYNTLSKVKPLESSRKKNIKVIGLKSKLGLASNILTHQLGRPVIHHRRLQKILQPGAFDIIWYHNISLIGGPALLSYGDGLKVYEAHEHWLVCPTHVLWRHKRELCDARQCVRCVISYQRPPQFWRLQEFFSRQLDHVDTFIAKSEFSRNKHKEFGFPRKMHVVPYFLPEKSRPVGKTDSMVNDRPFFLFVGRLEKIKGLDQVIPVFANYPQADLLILGTGSYENKLKKLAAGIPNIRFLGRQDQEVLTKYYKAAIALIVPSVCYETFGIILIESFREGTPVIAHKIGPLVEIVNRCGGGLLYSNNNELIVALRKLQQSPSYRDSMGQAAKSGFDTNWCEKIVINRYYSTLRQAAMAKGNTLLASALKTG